MKRKILALLLSLAMLLSIGGMVEGTFAVGISVDSTRSSVTLGEVGPVVTSTPEAEPTVEPTPAPTEEPEATPTPTVEPEATVEPTPAPTVEPTPAPEEKAEHIEGCSDDCTAEDCACTCHAAQKTPEDEVSELYSSLMACTTLDEMSALVSSLTEEEAQTFLASLTAEQKAELELHINALAGNPTEDFEPINVVHSSSVAPFLPPVQGQPRLRARAFSASAAADDGNGLELSKSAVEVEGGYKITLEAFVTGNVTIGTTSIPSDIVLVLDVSGSMDGYSTVGSKTDTSQLDTKYGAAEGIYEYASTELTWQKMRYYDGRWQYRGLSWGGFTWKNIDEAFLGSQNIRITKLNALKISTQRFIDSVAAKAAEDDVDHRIAIVSYASDAKIVQSLVSVTDKSNDLKNAVLDLSAYGATAADYGMASAKTILDRIDSSRTSNRVVVMFTDGEPNHGSGFDGTVANSTIKNSKSIKESGATVYTIGVFEKADDTVPMPGNASDFNKYMHYVSSNFKYAESMSNGGNATYPAGGKSYYLAASNATDINNIFKTISENIQTPDIDLGSKTVVKDTVSQYFDLPEDTSDIHLYTAAAKEDGTFEDKKPAPAEVVATVQDGAVSVTGFDFSANFVSKKLKSDDTYGKKLIIEFTVTPKDGFIGGNDVPTNDWEHTAVYDKNKTEVEKFADANTTPTVNVPIKEPAFTVNNKTIYEGNSTAVSGLYTLPDTTGWQYDYVKVTAGAADVTTEIVSPTDCTNYTVKVTYAPKTDGTNSQGTANAMAGVPKKQTATVHVLKPTVTATVNDVQKYYGESYTLGDAANGEITVKWTDKTAAHTDIPAAEGTAPYTNADLALAYSTEAFTGQSGTVPKRDFDVTVRVMKGADEIEGAVITTTCSIADSGCTTPATDKTYTVHVKTCQLTITKQGGASDEPYVFTVLKNGQKYSEVTVEGNTSQTLYELPIGTYTVEEDTGWSWRYSANNGGNAALTAKDPTGSITCTNSSNGKIYWLNGFSQVVRNIFGISH